MTPITSSRYSYTETLERLQKTITDAGNTIFATIDQASAAAQAGLHLRPTTLIVFGNPKAGTALMDAFPLIALELPLKLLVWEDSAGVHLTYTPASELAARYQVTGKEAVITAIDAFLTKLVATVT